MIDVSAAAADIMATGDYQMYTRVESWFGSDLLDGDVPIDTGTETVDVTLNVPESIHLTVPALYEGVSYVPGDAIDHPLACWGQRLRINVGVGLAGGTVEWIRRQWCYITDTDVEGDSVNVTASGLLGLVLEADLISPVTAAGQFGAMLRQLVEPALTVDLSLAPTDRTIIGAVTWDGGRLDAVGDLLDGWPAVAWQNEDGVLVVLPQGDSEFPALDLTDGAGGTTMQWGTVVTREGGASAVVARGNTVAGTDVQGVVYDAEDGSPTEYGGLFNPLPVPYVWYSPLLTTGAQCNAAAAVILARRKAQAARRVTTDAVPNLALQARDGITVTSERLGLDARFGIVDQLTMPLTAKSGPMQLGVRLP